MSYTPSGTAALMCTAATKLETYPHTGRQVREMALAASASSEVHVSASGTSDPTPAQAAAIAMKLPPQQPFEDPQLAARRAERRFDGAPERWAESTRWLDGIIGRPLPKMLRATSVTIERDWTTPRHQPLLAKIDQHCREVIAITHLCNPIDQDTADQMLKDAAKLARSTDCRACGVPIDSPENRKLGLYDQWCYKRIHQWMRANPGMSVDDHTPEFCAWIRHNISTRMVGFDRPASIHSPIGRMTIPEGA